MKAIICDIDGSLMNPSSGLYVKEEIRDKIIQLEQKGILVILNSARTFQGVQPLAKQLQMEQFGGYCISCNGCHVYDMKEKKTVFEYTIDASICLELWSRLSNEGIQPGFTQPDYVVCEELTEGYYLDKENCQVDYILTHNPKSYCTHSIWKCTMSESKEKLDACFDSLKEELEKKYPLLIVRSTPTMADMVHRDSSKKKACSKLLESLGIDWSDVSYIGDGLADYECIQAAGLGVCLENGKKECKEVADMVVPSCYEDGCIEWLNYLLEEEK